MHRLLPAGIACLLLGAATFLAEPALDKKGFGKLIGVFRLALFLAGVVLIVMSFLV